MPDPLSDRQTIVIVEGVSDQVAVEALLWRAGRDPEAERIRVVPVGGAHAIRAYLSRLGGQRSSIRLAGLYDIGEQADVRRALEGSGFGASLANEDLEGLGFYACDADLEDELIRALGPARVEQVLAAQGELEVFRKFQYQPAQRTRSVERQLHRFMGTHSGRKAKYAAALVAELDAGNLPRPLARLLARVLADATSAL